MKVIIIHSDTQGTVADTLAIVESTDNLGHLTFTEIDQEDSTGYMQKNRHMQVTIQNIFNDILGMFGIRAASGVSNG